MADVPRNLILRSLGRLHDSAPTHPYLRPPPPASIQLLDRPPDTAPPVEGVRALFPKATGALAAGSRLLALFCPGASGPWFPQKSEELVRVGPATGEELGVGGLRAALSSRREGLRARTSGAGPLPASARLQTFPLPFIRSTVAEDRSPKLMSGMTLASYLGPQTSFSLSVKLHTHGAFVRIK